MVKGIRASAVAASRANVCPAHALATSIRIRTRAALLSRPQRYAKNMRVLGVFQLAGSRHKLQMMAIGAAAHVQNGDVIDVSDRARQARERRFRARSSRSRTTGSSEVDT